MDKNLHNNNDGLENFFHDRLNGYQDEPGLDMWDRIESRIPEKPRKNFKPLMIWTSGAVAACIILSLGFFTFQYKHQLDQVAQQLQDTKNSMASLEERLNNSYSNEVVPALVREEENRETNINTNPRIQEITKFYPQIVYVPKDSKDSYANHFSENKIPHSNANTGVVQTRNVDQPQQKKNKSIKNMPIMAFASHQYNQVSKKDILNLKKKILKPKNAIYVNKKQLNKNKFSQASNKFAISSNTKIASLAYNDALSKHNRFKDKEIDSIMNMRSQENRLRELNFNKVVRVGANYSINNNLSLFLGPDYMQTIDKQPRTLNTNNLYTPVGLESGVTYHF